MSKPKIAFICVHNSCRSQIAEAFGKVLAADVFESCNYGLSPSVLEMLLFVVSIVLLLFTMKYKKGVFQNEENC